MSAAKPQSAPHTLTACRSVCPVACGLDVFGDKWTLLVVRDLLFGDKRFKDFAAGPERISTNLLSDRLTRLLAHDIIKQVPPPDGSKHLAYRLTTKGEALRPVLAAMRDWGLAWVPDAQALIGADQADLPG